MQPLGSKLIGSHYAARSYSIFPIQVGADLCIGMRRKCIFYRLYDFQGSDIPDCAPFLARTVFNGVRNRSDPNLRLDRTSCSLKWSGPTIFGNFKRPIGGKAL